MDKLTKQSINKKLLPFVVSLIGVLIIVIALFLPYMTAVGELAEYIEKYPDNIENEEFDMTASDLKDIPMMLMGKIATSAYSEEEGILFNVIVIVFVSLAALTALFVILKKPIAVMIFELIAFGSFTILNIATKADFFGADKYACGIGYYAIVIAFAIVFAGAIWMLIKKIAAKKELKIERTVQPEA